MVPNPMWTPSERVHEGLEIRFHETSVSVSLRSLCGAVAKPMSH